MRTSTISTVMPGRSDIRLRNNHPKACVAVVALAFAVLWTDAPANGAPGRGGFERQVLEVAEGQVGVGAVRVLNPESPVMVMRITGGADAALFSIGLTAPPEDNARMLRFLAPPDFENPLDVASPASGDGGTDDAPTPMNRANNNEYIVRVRVDFADSDPLTRDIVVRVTNTAEGRRLLGQAHFRRGENNADITQLQFVNIDDATPVANPGVRITGGSDAALFEVDSATGRLRFLVAPNFERLPANTGNDNIFQLRITATEVPVVDLTVEVVDEDDAPVLLGPTTITLSEDITSTAIQTYQGTDEDDDLLTYRIEGTDAMRFTIDAFSGQLSFRALPDYEVPEDANSDNVYELSVIVSGATRSPKRDRQPIQVIVTDVDEALMFADQRFLVGSGALAVGQLSVRPGQVLENTVTYSLVSGADQARFRLSGDQLMFRVAPDFASREDADGDNIYVVIVEAAAVLAGTAITDQATIRAEVHPGVVENVTDLRLLPADNTAMISGGVDAHLFRINGGLLSFISAPDFENPRDAQSTEPPDAALNNRYVVETTDASGTKRTHLVSVTDQENEASEAGTDQLVAAGEVVTLRGQAAAGADTEVSYSWNQVSGRIVTSERVDAFSLRFRVPPDAAGEVLVFRYGVLRQNSVLAEDDVAVRVLPAAFLEPQSLTLSEGTAPGTELGTPLIRQHYAMRAAGRLNAVPSGLWSIVGGDPDGHFAVDRETGQVSLRRALDFEGRSTHAITVEYAQEDVRGQGVFTLTVTNRNEPPIINIGADRQVRVLESVMLSAEVSDPEQAAGALSYQWTQLEGTAVSLTGATQATASFTPDRRVSGMELVFRLVVIDEGGLRDQDIVRIDISDEPVDLDMLEAGEAMIMEDVPIGTAIGAPLDASSIGVGTGIWRIVSGNDANLFDIRPVSGQVRLQGLLDFEDQPMHSLEISYQLGVLRGTGMLVITVEDADEPPVADAGRPERVVSSGQEVALNASLSSDPEDGAPVDYLWEQIAGDTVMLDDSASVSSTFIAPVVTASAPVVLQFRLTVTDSTDLMDVAMQDVRVVNGDAAPTITTERLSVEENQKEIGLIVGVDQDQDPIIYLIGPDGDGALFELTEAGELSFRAPPDFEAPQGTGGGGATASNLYLLNVTATSVRDGARAQSANRSVIVAVTNSTDEAPVFTLSDTMLPVVEGDATAFVRLSARDPEEDVLSYSLVGGADRAQFTLEGATGDLSFRIAPDFEVPLDERNVNPPNPARDNTYVVVVRVTDDGTSGQPRMDTLTLLIQVSDNPAEALTAAEFTVPATAARGDAVGRPLAIDGSFRDERRWSIVAVAAPDPNSPALIPLTQGDLFAIDATTGQLSIGMGLDLTLAETYQLTIGLGTADRLFLEGVASIDVNPDPTPGTVRLSETSPRVNVGLSASLEELGAATDLRWQWQVMQGERWDNITGATSADFVPTEAQGSRALRAFVSYLERGIRRRVASEASDPVVTDVGARQRVLKIALAVIGRSMAEDALDVLGRRMSGHGRDLLSIGGFSLSPTHRGDAYGASALGWTERLARLVTARQNQAQWDWLNDTRFAMRLGGRRQAARADQEQQTTGTPEAAHIGDPNSVPLWVVWGEGSRRDFSGGYAQDISSLRGDTESAWFGLERYFSPYGLAGGALQYSESELGFESEQEGEGRLTARMTTFYPYVHYSPANGFSLWGMGGYGIGHTHYRSEASGGIAERAGANYWLFAGGSRYDLLGINSGRALFSIKADGFYGRLAVQPAGRFIPSVRGAFSRFRVGFAMDFDWRLGGQANALVSSLEINARLDGGDAERGVGLAMNFDTTWRHLPSGLALFARVYRLIAHENRAFKQSGLRFGASLDSGRLGEGLALSIAPSFGGTQPVRGGSASLANIGAPAADAFVPGTSTHLTGDRQERYLKLKASYGILAGQLRFTPQLEMDMGFGGRQHHTGVFLKLDWIRGHHK